MKRGTWFVVVVVVACFAGGCEDPRTAIEDAVFEKLECEEVARPSTLGRIRTFLEDPNLDNAGAVLLNPQDLATMVSVLGPEAEVGVIVTRNALDVSPQISDVLKHGWPAPGDKPGVFDGVTCGEPVEIDCVAGSGTVIYACHDDGFGTSVFGAVDVVLDKCVVDSGVYDGAVSLVKDGDDHARAIFDALSINETKVVSGDVRLAVCNECGFEASVRTSDGGLTIEDFGGPDAGLECGEELRVDTLAFSDHDDVAHVELAGAHRTTEETYGVAGDVRFDGGCACPLPGSVVKVDIPRPLGKEGAVAHAAVSYAKSNDDIVCATASVALSGWPTGCFGDDTCGEGATEAVLGGVLTATCVLN